MVIKSNSKWACWLYTLCGFFIIGHRNADEETKYTTFVKYGRIQLHGGNKDKTTGLSVRGIMECAVHTSLAAGSGFYYDVTTKTCMTFHKNPQALVESPRHYWIKSIDEKKDEGKICQYLLRNNKCAKIRGRELSCCFLVFWGFFFIIIFFIFCRS